MNILNINKRIQEKKLKEFEETARKAAGEIDEILMKYDLKIVPFIAMSHWGNSPLIAGMNAGFTFQPVSKAEKEMIELKKKQKQDKDKQAPIENEKETD